MKKKLIVKQEGDRLYIRHGDLKQLKPLLSLANIEVKETQEGKHTGVPRFYIPLHTGFKFLESVTSDYTITFM